MATLRNHPGFWMRDDAEASLARWEADHGIIGVNSAGRYEWEQQEFIDRWDQGGKYNRPPYLYEPKRPPRASAHVANGGRAFDTSEWRRFLQTCAAYGWVQVYDWDVVHFEYFPERDTKRDRPSGGGTTPPTIAPQEDDMPIIIVQKNDSAAAKGQLLHNKKIRLISRAENNVYRDAQRQDRTAVIYTTVSNADFADLLAGK